MSALQPSVLDLFCGGGGFSAGFTATGFRTVAGVDHDATAVETWEKNHTGTGYETDLTQTTPPSLEDALNVPPDDVDVVIGGPPCTDFTKVNQVTDLGRNHLVPLFATYVAYFQPRVFVMENVRQLTTQHEDVLDQAYDIWEEAGYHVAHRLLDAADYGVPQHRIRATVIGIHDSATPDADDPRFPAPTHGPASDDGPALNTAGDALRDVPRPLNPDEYQVPSKHAPLLDDIPPGLNYHFYTKRLGHPDPEFEWRSRFSDFLYKADPQKPVRTIKASPGAANGPFHWDNRRFTEAELAALQSFPSNFEFVGGYTAVQRQIGNSVPPNLAAALARAVARQVFPECDVAVADGLVDADTDLGFRSRRRTPTCETERKAAERIDELYD